MFESYGRNFARAQWFWSSGLIGMVLALSDGAGFALHSVSLQGRWVLLA